ncbi:hypothetical protein JTB14_019719 [Gonioctena quinquepunctata]|nr:hypothetical protein JTB14_019719 [Gonioctena quinquepunctata]
MNVDNLSVPLLRSMIMNKNISQQLERSLTDLLGSKASIEVMRTLKDLPILTVKTSIKNVSDNSSTSCTDDHNVLTFKMAPDKQCIFELSIYREGSSKMNVYSKKFNKQKEEFWFLIFVEEDSMSFRKFSFSKRMKKLDIPVQMPSRKGNFTYTLMIMSDCYIGFDQVITYRVRTEGS